MRTRLVLPITAILSLITVVALAAAGTAPPPKGKEIFLAQKCNMCHSISVAAIEATTKSEKMKGPDLTGVVDKKGAEWAGKYLTKQVDMNGKKHGKEVKLSPEEMKDLLDWLAAQKKPE